jgi:hypothetical protein
MFESPLKQFPPRSWSDSRNNYLANLHHPDLVFGAAIFAWHHKRDRTLVSFLCQLSLCLQMRTLVPGEYSIRGGAFLTAT